MYYKNAEITAHKMFDADQIVKLLLASYRFSQGNQMLQHRLLEQVVSNNSHCFGKRQVRQARKIARPLIESVVTSRVHRPVNSIATISGDLKRNVDAQFPAILKQDRKGLLHPQPLEIARQMLISDHEYVSGKHSPRTYGGLHPHTSYFMRYVVAEKPTDSAEYKYVFSDVRTAFKLAAQQNNGDGSGLQEITRSQYNHNQDIQKHQLVFKAHMLAHPADVAAAESYFADTIFADSIPRAQL